MTTYSITRDIDIHYAHRVMRHPGQCSLLHGHRGVVTVTVEGPVKIWGGETDMVFDFGVLDSILQKQIKRVLCHATILQFSDPLLKQFNLMSDADWKNWVDMWTCTEPNRRQFTRPLGELTLPSPTDCIVVQTSVARLVTLRYSPTAERLAEFCGRKVQAVFNDRWPCDVRVVECRFQETAHSTAVVRF